MQAKAKATRRATERPLDKAFIDDLVAANRTLARLNVLDAFGHVSVRDPRNPHRYLISRSIAPESVTAADILVLDLDSQAVDPKDDGKLLYRERFIHGEIYKARPDVNAVVHSHSPTVVPFTVTRAKLRPLLHNAGFLGLGVPLFEIRKSVGDGTDLMILTPNLGKDLAKKLGKDAAVVLMRGHGDSVVGPVAAQRGVSRLLHRDQCAPAARRHHHRRPDQFHDPGGGDHFERRHAARLGAAMGAVAQDRAEATVKVGERVAVMATLTWNCTPTRWAERLAAFFDGDRISHCHSRRPALAAYAAMRRRGPWTRFYELKRKPNSALGERRGTAFFDPVAAGDLRRSDDAAVARRQTTPVRSLAIATGKFRRPPQRHHGPCEPGKDVPDSCLHGYSPYVSKIVGQEAARAS